MRDAFVDDLVRFVRAQFGEDGFIPLHAPQFGELERTAVLESLESGMVSSVGQHVREFEDAVARYTGASYAVATVNGTAALQTALRVAGVQASDEVITQTVTFVATCNAIRYLDAEPVLMDIEQETLGLCPNTLEAWLEANAALDDAGHCRNRHTGRVVRACMPMHNLGHPARIGRIAEVCKRWRLTLVEDTAESLGSFSNGQHTGRVGRVAAISFNGNKIITTGGGGMLITDDEVLASRAKHLTTTAKQPHPWLYVHDELGYNYRLPAINAALGCAQMQRLPDYVDRKRALADRYGEWFDKGDHVFFREPPGARSNYWFNSFFAHDREQRDRVLEATNHAGVMTRPVWTPMHTLPLYQSCQRSPMPVADRVEARLVNIPSSVPSGY